MNANILIGRLATWIAGIAVCSATIVFGLAQTTNFVDSVILCSILIALALFGKSLATVCKGAIFKNPVKALVIVILIIALDILQIFEVYGWKSNMDALFGENTDMAKADKLKIELAQAKVKMLEVGKVDVNQAANELAEIDRADKKCTAWRLDCRRKATAGKDAIQLKLDAQKESVASISEAMAEIKSTEANSGNYAHRAFKGLAVLVETETLKVQSGYRLAVATLIVLLYSLGDIFFAPATEERKRFFYVPSPTPEQVQHEETEIETQKPQSWAERWQQGDVSLVGAFRQSPSYSVNQPVAKASSKVSLIKQPPKVSDSELSVGYGFSTVSDDNEEKPIEPLYNGTKKAFGFIPETENGTEKETLHGSVSTEKTENKSVLKPVANDLGTHCEQCGTEFPKPRTGKKFCNAKCRREAWTQINGKTLNEINENRLD